MLHNLSKKASRKNLNNFIQTSISQKIENKDIGVLNVGAGGELQKLIEKNFENVFSIDVDKNRSPDQLLDICDDNFSDNLKIKPSLICCFEVLEHTKDPNKAIKNIYKVLNEGDYFLSSTPYNFHINERHFGEY